MCSLVFEFYVSTKNIPTLPENWQFNQNIWKTENDSSMFESPQILQFPFVLFLNDSFIFLHIFCIIIYFNAQQTIENEFHVAISAEKSSSSQAARPSTSADATPSQRDEQPTKPPRQRPKSILQVETTINNLDDENGVSDSNK